jgi:hypothetical protein
MQKNGAAFKKRQSVSVFNIWWDFLNKWNTVCILHFSEYLP